jgi:uncharacterized delta-60 repeat protein
MIRAVAAATAAASVALLAAAPAGATPPDLDQDFGDEGKVTTDLGRAEARAVAIDSQGRIVVAGSTGDGSADFALARYMPDGSLDPAFGTGGVVTTDFGGYDPASEVALDSSGRIVVGGSSLTPSGTHAALARYRANGSLDPSFGSGGKVVTDLGADEPSVGAMIIDSEGRIVLAGQTYRYHDEYNYYDYLVARLTPSGKPDPSFGHGGTVGTDFGVLESARALALDSRNRIIAAGRWSNYGEEYAFAVARYGPNGALDPSFGSGGTVTTQFANDAYDAYSDSADAVAIDDQDRIIAGGGGGESGDDFALVRYGPGGALDPSFGDGGKVQTSFGAFESAAALAIDPRGRIVAVGSRGTRSSARFALARYRPTGSLDGSFGIGGRVTTGFGPATQATAAGAAIDSQGQIVAVGTRSDASGSDFALARYTGLDGTPPDVTIRGPKKVKTPHRKARARFRLESSEPARLKCKVDRSKYRRCRPHYRTRKLPVGRHRLKVRATDRAGNRATDKKRFRIVEKR